MPDVNVGAAWVNQETLYYCGPATMEMLLATLGVARPAAPPTWQDRLWAAVETQTGATRPPGAPSSPTSPPFPTQKCEWCAGTWKCWATTPGVLETIVNQYQGVGDFTVSRHASEVAATDALLDTIDLGLPAIALVHGWQHWIVVEGYRHGEPGADVVAGRNLNGVYIRDPKDTEYAVHYITWDQWKLDYLSSVPCGDYEGAYVVMGGTRRTPLPRPPSPPTNVRITDSGGPLPLPARSLAPRKLISPDQALAAARAAADALRGSQRLNPGLAGADARWATLVQRLDHFDAYYYIVGFMAQARETARVIVDAHEGRYTDVLTIPDKDKSLPPYVPMPVLRQRLAALGDRRTVELRFQPRPEAIGDHPIPVWKPCGQSSSPFLPFYQYTIGNAFVYYRLDGVRFDELTEGPA